jgi:drug/metabolite transporter (DMT)-like permease
MASNLAGLGFLVVFALSQAVRDTFFGNTFQSVSFLFVAALAFGLSTLIFGGWAALKRPSELRILSATPVRFCALNGTTAFAWLAYFFALTHLEPAIVAMLYVGIGPIVVLFWSSAGAGPSIGRAEFAAYLGIGLSLVGIAAVSLLGHSGMSAGDTVTRAIALAGALAGGVSITVSHVFARRFNDDGAGSDLMLGSRFVATVAAALLMEFLLGVPSARPDGEQFVWIAFCAFALIVIPSFSLQLGIARSTPLTVNVIRALGPVFVFAAQTFDDRLGFSGATLVCIAAFSLATMIASGLRTRREIADRDS